MRVLPLACVAGALALAAYFLFFLRTSNLENEGRSELRGMSNHDSGKANASSEFEVFKLDDGTIQLAINGKSFQLRFPDGFDTTNITEQRVVDGNRSGGLLCAILLKETGEDLAKFWCCMIGDENVIGGVRSKIRRHNNNEGLTNTLSVVPVLCGQGPKESRFLAASTELYQLVVITGRSARHSVREGNIFVSEYQSGAEYAKLGKFVTEYPEHGLDSQSTE